MIGWDFATAAAKRIGRVVRNSQLGRLGRIGAFCLACGAAIVGLGSGGLFGPSFEGPDDVLGYGDNLVVTTASGSNTSYPYSDDYSPLYVITGDAPDSTGGDDGTLVVRWSDDYDPDPLG